MQLSSLLAHAMDAPVEEVPLEYGLPDYYQKSVLPFYTRQCVFGTFPSRSGVSLCYAKYEVADEKGALVIIGGRTEFLSKYAEFLYDLRDSGYSLYVYDHAGQGESGRLLQDSHKGYIEDFQHYVDDLHTFIETVVNAREHAKLFVLGFSMGGTVAGLYGEQHRTGVNGLLLVSPMFGINTAPFPGWFVHLVCRTINLLGGRTWYVIGGTHFDEDRAFPGNDITTSKVRFGVNQQLVANRKHIGLGSPTSRWLEEAFRGIRQVMANRAHLTIPILLLQGAAESVVDVRSHDEFCATLPNCRMVSYPGAKHELLMEQDDTRDQVLCAIREFLGCSTAPGVP